MITFYLKLDKRQFESLKKGLLTVFRFYLRLQTETVQYNFKTNQLTIAATSRTVREQIHFYVNGFAQAIDPR